MNKYFSFAVIFLCSAGFSFAQSIQFASQQKEEVWVDSVFSTLDTREKIGQLMIIRASSAPADLGFMKKQIQDIKPSGLTFFAGEVLNQARATNELQKQSNVPLLISIDGEWGLAMRLKNTISFPYQMALGAIQEDQWIYEMGKEIARQCRRMGIHINFAPVLDVNNNPNNPVINYRSFGEDTWNVARKGYMYAKGMEDHGILSSIKHFPGHGDTGTDSHYALPLLNHNRERLDSLELLPFTYAIDRGISGIMIGHLNIPALDDAKDRPSSLSSKVVTELLKKEMGFQGVSFTDALEMKGVAAHFGAGSAAVESFKAGNDFLLMPENALEAVNAMENALRKREISVSDLNERVKKILRLKFRLGLHQEQHVKVDQVEEDINTPTAQLLNRNLIEHSITVIKNEGQILPLQNLDTTKIASVSIGLSERTAFQEGLSRYSTIDHFSITPENLQGGNLLEKLKAYDKIILGLHETQVRPRNNALYTDEEYSFIRELLNNQDVALVLFRNAYTLEHIDGLDRAEAVVVTYMDNEVIEDLASQLVFGGISAQGKLPVSTAGYSVGHGLEVKGGIRFKYTIPEELGIDSRLLSEKIDAVIQEGLDSAAFPGAEVFLAKDQKVFFHHVYGYHTYDGEKPVKKDDLYDFASVTKITGPLPALMKLHDEGRFDLDATMADDIPFLSRSNKKDLDWRNVLAHNARLKSWIPYWTTTFKKNGKYKRNTLSSVSSENFNYQLSEDLWMHKDYGQKINKMIRKSPLNEEPGYVYSGLPFYLFPGLIERRTGLSYEGYVKKEFYHELGAYTLTFNPSTHFELDRIVPTEKDTFFRQMQIHGVVHDEGAAMMKGVSGNAGLFGTANDLGKLMQMYLNMGTYGGKQFISRPTLTKFTSCQFCEEDNHRGLGFDKPLLENRENGTPAPSASMRSFGHSGYTGTFTWADPENDLLFIFFSNRVYPTRDNRKLYTMSIRPRIHEVVYELLRGEE